MKHEAEQLGLFENKEVSNRSIDVPWKKSETAKMLDLYLAGHHPNLIAQRLGRNPKAVKRRIEQFRCNEEDRAVRYEPFRRMSRKGKRITENEKLIIDAHRKRKIPAEITAKVLARDAGEIEADAKSPARIGDGKQLAASLDLVLAYRYVFFVYKKSIISDKAYDELKAEEIEFGAGARWFRKSPRDCPSYIKSLALYLTEKYEDKGNSRGS